MSKQVSKLERDIVKRENKYDPFNNHKDDYNRLGHKRITEDIIDYYCKCRSYNCEINYQKKMLKLNIDPPKCFFECYKKLLIHGCGTNGLYPICEFITNWNKKDINPNTIFMKRGDATFNFHYRLPIIFRPSWENGYHLHHWFGPLHDDPNTTAMLKSETHAKINKIIEPINKKILVIQQITIVEPDKYYVYKSELARLQNEREKAARVNSDSDFWVLIDNLHRFASNISEV
jgi:hypothetical protein